MYEVQVIYVEDYWTWGSIDSLRKIFELENGSKSGHGQV
jgi:hypothetical protein